MSVSYISPSCGALGYWSTQPHEFSKACLLQKIPRCHPPPHLLRQPSSLDNQLTDVLLALQAGANMIVSGSAVVKAQNPGQVISQLKQAVMKVFA